MTPLPTRAATLVTEINQSTGLVEPPHNPNYPIETIDDNQPDEAFQAEEGLTYTIFLPLVMSSSSEVSPQVSCTPTKGSGGLGVTPGEGKVVTIAGLSVGVIVGPNYDEHKPTYLAYYIHGDGAGDWSDFVDKQKDGMTLLAKKHNWIFITPLAPNETSWWKNHKGDHVAKFAEVLDVVFKKYNVCRETVLGASGSGGGVFLSGQFFPDKGGNYPVHAVLACGANPSNTADKKAVEALGKIPYVVKNSTFYYIYGTKDTQVSPTKIESSMTMYKDAGFTVKGFKLEGHGHCSDWKNEGLPEFREQIAEKWESLARNRLGIIP
jgi:hypothetical protein